jgi:DNA-binding transcriptional LysR family regulator
MDLAIAIRDRMIAVELRHLEYFVAVAAELNFSRAAQRIHVVQSALSASVGKLEKELGVELFDRSKRQITLTAAGEVFLERAREVIHTAHRARTSVDAFRDQLSGTVTLGTLMSWGTLDLAAALEDFRLSNPLITVRLRQSLTGSAGHLTAIADGQMDLALVSISSPGSQLVALRELMSEPMVFVCESSHALADRRKVTLADPRRARLHQLPTRMGNPTAPRRRIRRRRRPPARRVRGRRLRDRRRTHPAPVGNRRPARERGQPLSRPSHRCAAAIHDMDAVNCLRGVPTRQPGD